jgi:hypothetical protein
MFRLGEVVCCPLAEAAVRIEMHAMYLVVYLEKFALTETAGYFACLSIVFEQVGLITGFHFSFSTNFSFQLSLFTLDEHHCLSPAVSCMSKKGWSPN